MLSSQARALADIAWEAGTVILGHYGGSVEMRRKHRAKLCRRLRRNGLASREGGGG